MLQPDYHNNSIVNLMSSLVLGLGGPATLYPPLVLLPPEKVTRAANVVLLVIDGLGYNYLKRQKSVLNQYLRGYLTSVFPTSTAPAITTFLTGVAPQQHGVTGWFMHLRELGAVTLLLPFQPRWGTVSFAAAGINVAELIGYASVFDRLDARCCFIIQQNLVDSPYSVAGAGCAERIGYHDLADCFRAIANSTKRVAGRRYVYAYWPLLDKLSHQYGVSSQRVQIHLCELERSFMHLLEVLKGTDTLVVVTADHGFIDTDPRLTVQLADHPELAKCLVMPLCGEPRVAFCYVRPGLCRQFERYVEQRLREYCEVYASLELLDRGWFGLGEPDPRLQHRIGDYVLISKDSYVIKDALPGEKPWTDLGVHGGVSEDELYVPLIMAHC